ncbi:hypothetical protein BDR06DRAFT_963089 [Suillus hirtellus]|nr:hypothetical protein BDR06DRAFT_963089 [Suillus hirtellus]
MDEPQMDTLTRFACRKRRASFTSIAVARLGQPCGSSCWRSGVSENIHKRITLDHDIIAQVRDITSVDTWMSRPWTYYRSVSSPLHNSPAAQNEITFPTILICPLIGGKGRRNIRSIRSATRSSCLCEQCVLGRKTSTVTCSDGGDRSSIQSSNKHLPHRICPVLPRQIQMRS